MRTDAGETRTRARTRQAILDAAVTVLTDNPSASLGEVARAAGVSRSTLQRYFAERTDLLEALSVYAYERVEEATERARVDEGDVVRALTRVLEEYFELGDILMLAYQGGSEKEAADDGSGTRQLLPLIERGHAEGVLDRSLPAEWIEQFLWSCLFAAWTHTRVNGARKHDALAVCLRAFTKAVRA
ncbi:TetR/AcrR family transcriptional regulator [Sinosporangium siamense]|uniref:TetR/AcrR family transcriptional regulator n=1 Tax=Sinosporangium siamense TaxID=1367973 RepID=UPI001EF356AF|nr:TetR/AcrR family transcriptional regulator [Sinosporangium siamense]